MSPTIRTPYTVIAERLRGRVDEPSVQPTGTPPERVAGGLGVVPGAEAAINTTRRTPAPRPLTAREADRLLTAELLQAVRTVTEQTSALTAAIGRKGALNGVLETALVTIPAEGYVTRDYPTAVGSLVVTNHAAPTTGPAVSTIDPAAGAEISFTVPAGETWELQSFEGALVTSAVVANRQVSLIIDNGAGATLARIVAAATQAASLTYVYSFSDVGYEYGAVRDNKLVQGLPRMTLAAGWTVRTSTLNLDVGDNWGPAVVGAALSYVRTTTAAGLVTVHSGPPSSSGATAPTTGRGVHQVAAGERSVMPIGDRAFTIWGTAGDELSIQAFTGLQPFGGTL